MLLATTDNFTIYKNKGIITISRTHKILVSGDRADAFTAEINRLGESPLDDKGFEDAVDDLCNKYLEAH